MIGATITCSRSRQPAARKRDTVSATAFDQDLGASRKRRALQGWPRAKVPDRQWQPNNLNARDRQQRTSLRGYQNATDTVLIEYPRSCCRSRPFGSMTTRAGCCPATRRNGQLRIVGYRSTDADNDRIDVVICLVTRWRSQSISPCSVRGYRTASLDEP